MAIQWGGYSNHLRVGLDIWTDNYDTYTPAINIYVAAYVQCDSSWNFNDAQTVTLSGSVGGSWNFQNTLGANGVVHVGTGVVAGQGQNYNGGPYYEFYGTLSGNYLGGNSTVGVGYTLPARPKRVPTAPSPGPTMTSITDSSIVVSSYHSTDYGGGNPDEWSIQLATDAGMTQFVYFINDTSSFRTIGGLLPGKAYYARSQVRNVVGWSPPSAVSTATTAIRAATAPGTPTWSAVTATAATLSWADSTDYGGSTPTSYRLQLSTDPTFATTAYNATANNRSRTVSGLVPGATYYARVLTTNGAGDSAWSTSSSQTLGAFALSTPTVSGINPDTATVSWGTPSGGTPTGYQIEYALNAGFSSGLQTVTSGTWATTTGLTGLTPATTYYVRVRANTSAGYGSWSPAASFQTLSGAKVRVGGQWVNGVAWVRVDGAWALARVNKRVAGSWQL